MPSRAEAVSMQENRPFGLKSARHYLASVLMMLVALSLISLSHPIYSVLCFLAGVASLLSTRSMMAEIQSTCDQKTVLDGQLIQSQKLAAIGELSSGIAHEINNPLAIIGQEVEWIRHVANEMEAGSGLTVTDMQDSVQEIARQVERCGEITHKLLDFARKKEPLIQAVDINKLIEDMVRLVEREAKQHNIVIERQYGEEVPRVRTDGPLVRQVVLNILNNATYAINKDGTIRVATHAVENGAADIVITDTGGGIPKEDLNMIFDPFFTTKPPGKGTGLGLSICHGIITRLGGRIYVESEVGRGTTFTVHLPGVHQ
jgi:two-component system, NtrC family, sensor kinase